MSQLDELFGETLDLGAFPDREQLWSALPGGGGAYALSDHQDRLILLASAQSLRRSIRHRLTARPQNAAPAKRADLASITRRLRWSRSYSPFETALIYYRLARALYPKKYGKMVAFGPAWFVHVDPETPLPRFVPTSRVYQGPGCYWGPYATRGRAAEAIAELEDFFDLCRYHDVLDKSPHGQACTYHEMGKCPAPCDGSVSVDLYKQHHVEPARAFAWGRRREQIERWRRLMEDASRELAFERAAALKSRIERALRPVAPKHPPARDAADFNYLVVQRAGGTSWVKPFFVTAGRIETDSPVRLKALENALETWTRTLAEQRHQEAGTLDLAQRAEQVWLVSRFLFKGDSAAGCFLHETELHPPGDALQRLREAFPARARSRQSAVADRAPADSMEPAESLSPDSSDSAAGAADDNTENPEPVEN